MKITSEIEVIWFSPRSLSISPSVHEFHFHHILLWDDLIGHIKQGGCGSVEKIVVILDAACQEVTRIFSQYQQLNKLTPQVSCHILYGRAVDAEEISLLIQKSLQSLKSSGEQIHDHRYPADSRS